MFRLLITMMAVLQWLGGGGDDGSRRSRFGGIGCDGFTVTTTTTTTSRMDRSYQQPQIEQQRWSYPTPCRRTDPALYRTSVRRLGDVRCTTSRRSRRTRTSALRLLPPPFEPLDSTIDVSNTTGTAATSTGLYRSFAESAWQYLLLQPNDPHKQHSYNLSVLDLPTELQCRETWVPAGGSGGGGGKDVSSKNKVRITVQAAVGNHSRNSSDGSTTRGPIQYARYALIETIGCSTNDDDDRDDVRVHTDGIQVLNMVIFPSPHTGLPVFGADFVSLPGNKHLLLLDAQPVHSLLEETEHEEWFQEWYQRNQIQQLYTWGGDMPEPVQQYVSKYALWTRLGSTPGKNRTTDISTTNLRSTDTSNSNSTGTTEGTVSNDTNAVTKQQDDPIIQLIQGPVMNAFMDHLTTYVQLLDQYDPVGGLTSSHPNNATVTSSSSRLPDYLKYRLDNDPARPMLKRLFGPEWTEQILHEVLFPIHMVLPSEES